MGDGEEESVGKMLEKSGGFGCLSALVETIKNRVSLSRSGSDHNTHR
jgi:hypothetical protein